MTNENYWLRAQNRRVSRRGLLRGTATAGAGLAGLALVGCGDDDDTAASPTAAGPAGTTTAAASPTTPVATRKLGGTLRVGNGTMLGQFEPNVSTSAIDWAVLYAIYDTLFTTDYAGTIKPNLVSSYEVTSGQITLKLRPDVKFQDGTPFNAQALKRNVERTLQLGAQSRVFSQWSQVETVTTPDASTAVLKLKTPQYGPLIANLAGVAGAMPSPDAIEKLGEDFRGKPVGSGPYKVDSVQLDSRVVLTANKEYWNAKEGGPYLDKIDFKIVAQAPALVTSMQAGELDLIHYAVPPSAAELDQIKTASGISLTELPGHSFQEVRINRGKPPFDNTDLLKAFGYAIDRKALLAGIFGNAGVVAGGPINPATWAFDPNFKGFNLTDAEREAKVKEHLQKAGSASGFNLTLDYGGTATQTAEAIAQLILKHGLKAEIKALPVIAGGSALFEGLFTAVPSFTPQYSPDPDSIFRPNFYKTGQFNYHRYSNPELDALLDKAAEETDQAKRKTLYWDAQKLVFESGIPRIPTIHSLVRVPVRKTVKDLVVGFDSYVRLGAVWLDS
ncbi:MAG: ABC transporter substrate-binding protein [Dehalococcoidia bacterium]